MTTDAKLDLILEKLEKLDALDGRVGKLEERMDTFEERLDNLEKEFHLTRLMIENEVSPNIRRVAEGHLDLARNLMDVRSQHNELEMLVVKVNAIETFCHRIQSKIA